MFKDAQYKRIAALAALSLTVVGCKADQGAQQAPLPAVSSSSTPSSEAQRASSSSLSNQNTDSTNALVGNNEAQAEEKREATAEPSRTSDSNGEYHLDPDPLTPARRPQRPNQVGELELTLRSTPPGAIASIDGQPIGPTPAYWSGDKTTGAREFTFALAGFAVARYRFVPTRSGVVHGTLRRLVAPAIVDAGPPPTAR